MAIAETRRKTLTGPYVSCALRGGTWANPWSESDTLTYFTSTEAL